MKLAVLEIRETVVAIFAARRRFERLGTGEETLRADYVKAGLVDSLGIIELIHELESRFDVTFSNDDLASREFRSIAGVVELIGRHVGSQQRPEESSQIGKDKKPTGEG